MKNQILSQEKTIGVQPWKAPIVSGIVSNSRSRAKPVDQEALLRDKLRQELYQELHAQAQAQVGQDLAQQINDAKHLWAQAFDFSQKFDDNVVNEIQAIVNTLVKKIIGQAIEVDENLYKDIINKALTQLPISEQQVCVKCAAPDYDRLNTHMSTLANANRSFQIETDENLHIGELKLSTQNTEIDLRMDERIEKLLNDAKDSHGSS